MIWRSSHEVSVTFIRLYAEAVGYSSTQEFVVHALEKEIASIDEADSDEEIQNKLNGLSCIS